MKYILHVISKPEFSITLETNKALFIGHGVEVEWIDIGGNGETMVSFSDEFTIEVTMTNNLLVRKKGW